VTDGSHGRGSDRESVEASGRMGTSAIRSEISWHMELRGRCFAELTAGCSHDIRCIAFKEPCRRK